MIDSTQPGLERIADYNERDYRTVWARGPRADFEDHFESRLIRALLSPEPGWMIDLGAGYGRLSPLYARPDRTVVMVDYAVNLLEIAAEDLGARPDVHFIAANAYHLPFRSAVFAVGLSHRTFHHMAHPALFFGELGRVIRPNGSVLLEYSNKRNLLRIARFGRPSLHIDHEEYSPNLFGTHPQLFAQLADSAGFTVASTAGTGFFSRLLGEGERWRGLIPLLTRLEAAADATLGRAGLAPIHLAALKKSGEGVTVSDEPASLRDILQCPACGGELTDAAGGLDCRSCGRRFEQRGRILDLRHRGHLG
jgi:ubiquinone/menaquinone biosynthesis C-methylase UbiE